MRVIYFFILILCFSVVCLKVNAQTDSTSKFVKTDSATKVNNGKEILLDTLQPTKDSVTKKESVVVKKHDPHKATIRSAILPGWGQAYNHEYWKLPIVYGALAVPGSLFIYNNKWYQRTKDAYNILINGGDTSEIYSDLKGISASNMQSYRNSFRKNRDYSALFFLLVWGLNVADATVFAHLKDFDVSNDLSMHIQPDYNISTRTPSLSVALNFKTKQVKTLPASF